MKGRQASPASALAFCFLLTFESVFAQTSTTTTCESLDMSDPTDDALSQRLSCYNSELDNLSLLIGSLLQEREQLSVLLDGAKATEITEDATTDQQNTIDRLRQERSELSAQLHRKLIENHEKLLNKEAEERLLRNYSQAYLAIADENAELAARINTLNQRITQLEQTNTKLADNNTQVEQNNKNYQVTINDLSAQKTQLTSDLSKKESLIAKLRAQLLNSATLSERLATDVNTLRQELGSAHHTNKIAEGNIAHLNKAIAGFAATKRNERQHYDSQLKELHARLAQANSDNNSLTTAAEKSSAEFRQQLETQISEIEALSVELTNLQQNRDVLKAQLEAADQLLAQQNDSIADLNQNIQDQQQTIATQNVELLDLKDQLDDTAAELNFVRSEIAAKSTALGDTQQILETTQQQFDASEQELASVKDIASELKNQVAALESQLVKTSNTAEQLQGSLNTKISEFDKISQSRAAAVAASESLLDINTALRQDLSAANADLTEARTNNALLKSLVNEQQSENDASSAEIEGLQQKVVSQQTLLDQSHKSNELFAESLEIIKSELDASNDRLADQQRQLQTLIAEKEAIVVALTRSQTETEQLAQDISSNLDKQGQTDSVMVDVLSDNTIELQIASNQLFRVGSSRLSAEGRLLLESVATALGGTSKRRIMIEGHSDNLPLGPKLAKLFKDNMGLSMARALSAANFLAEDTDLPEQQLSISGAGDTRPIATNDTAAGRQQNRRVEILLLPLEYTDSEG